MAPPAGSADTREVVYGIRTVLEVLRAGQRPLQRILVLRPDGPFGPLVGLARAHGIPVAFESRDRLDRLVPQRHHQGVIGIVAAKAYSHEDDVMAFATSQPEPALLLILDGVEDPQNLGAILRTAESTGVHGIFIPERRAVGLTSGVAKASAGALEYMNIAQVTNIGKLIERLQQREIPAYAFTPDAPTRYTDLSYCGPLALVLGGEGKGIRPGVLEKCATQAAIPMKGHIQSLNVSATAAVVLFEVVRQRTAAAGRAT